MCLASRPKEIEKAMTFFNGYLDIPKFKEKHELLGQVKFYLLGQENLEQKMKGQVRRDIFLIECGLSHSEGLFFANFVFWSSPSFLCRFPDLEKCFFQS